MLFVNQDKDKMLREIENLKILVPTQKINALLENSTVGWVELSETHRNSNEL